MTEEATPRGRWVPVVLLAGVLAPYTPMLVGSALPFSDDFFVSDLIDGEFPARVEVARNFVAGQGAAWLPGIFGGAPIAVDPLSLLLFSLLPPALALGWFIGLCLAVAATGTYLLARRYQASLAGAALAGFAYAWSGFFVCQLRHLSVLGTVALFPLALWCLEHAASPGVAQAGAAQAGEAQSGKAQSDASRIRTWTSRTPWAMAFALVFGLQLSFGFPQSAYGCALVYGLVAAVRLTQLQWGRASVEEAAATGVIRRQTVAFATLSLAAVLLGAGVGMMTLLPLAELGGHSDRAGAGTFEWATRFNYWLPNVWTFLMPYVNGDVSDLTYVGRNVFWEDYGYVGWMTILLVGVAVVVWVRGAPVRHVGLWFGIGTIFFLLVLGRHTPVYGWAFEFLPGLSRFRMPTRFLFVVELALALLGAQGLSWLQTMVAERLDARRPVLVAALAAWGVTTWTGVDLVLTNARQNAWVDAEAWLEPPHSARVILDDPAGGRVYTPGNEQLRGEVPLASKGWAGDLRRYVDHREFLPPNANLLFGVSTANGYAGIAPRWAVDLVGDHNRHGMLTLLLRYDGGVYSLHPAALDLLEAMGVRWLLLVADIDHERLERVDRRGELRIHRLRDALPRARLVARGRHVADVGDVLRALMGGTLDLREEVVVHEAEDAALAAGLLDARGAAGSPDPAAPGHASIVQDEASTVVVDVDATQPAFLLLADTYYPGWTATLDDAPLPILRANVAYRAVVVPPGRHRVVFRFEAPTHVRGLVWTSLSLVVISLVWALAVLVHRRHVVPSAKASGPEAAGG